MTGGIIYLISSPNTKKVYIGKTVKSLRERFGGHNAKNNTTRSSLIFEYGDAEIKELYRFKTCSKIELSMKELEFINIYKDVAVNAEVYDLPKKNKEENLTLKKLENKIKSKIEKREQKKEEEEIQNQEFEYDAICWYEANIIKKEGSRLNRSDAYRNYVTNSKSILGKYKFFDFMVENAGLPQKTSGVFCYKNISLK
jgi:hypothetical protein